MKNPVRYLLGDRKTGDWIIAKDIAGKTICLKQHGSDWAKYPDTDQGFWQRKNGKFIDGWTVAARNHCTGSFCELKDDNNDDIQFTSLDPTNVTNITNDNGNIVSGKDRTLFLYIGCGVGGILMLFIILSVGMFCVKKRSDEGKRESIDENPDYRDDYYEGRSQVMDQNDYYSIDV